MLYVLYTIFFVSCIVLVAAVLLQPGKTDAGALFTSNVSSAAFGPRGTASVLSKLTIVAAIIFMLTALLISMPALSGGVSVLSGSEEAPIEETTTEAPAAEQLTEPANTNISTDNTNSALIETPATNSFQADVNAATNSAASNTAPANR
ncbi:MAG TPA: preprotein translocase subunit SecG [Pyrinomonadaceae bacterium]